MRQKLGSSSKRFAAALSSLIFLDAPGLTVPGAFSQVVTNAAAQASSQGMVPVPPGAGGLSAVPSPEAPSASGSLSLETSPAVRAAAEASPPAAGKGPAAVSVRTRRIAARVSKALGAGRVEDKAPGNAYGLGADVQAILSGASDGGSPPSDVGGGGDDDGQTPSQKVMLRTLKRVASVYTEHYAPIEMKGGRDVNMPDLNLPVVDLREELDKARARVLAKPAISHREFRVILADFVAATRDYHAGIPFYSTELAGVPVTVMSARGRYYIARINRAALPEEQFPFQAGDEIVEFGGKPAAEAVAALKKRPNTAETDQRLAEKGLTMRSGRGGGAVLQGDLAVKIKTSDGTVHDATLTWKYTPERIPSEVPLRGVSLGPEEASDPGATPPAPGPGPAEALDSLREMIRRVIPSMAHPFAKSFSEEAAADPGNGFMIGGKESYVPKLGEVLWELPPKTAEQSPFKAYIYKSAKGRRVGYIRIPDYMGGGDVKAAAKIFGALIEKFQAETDALVVDQVNNPGGNMFYMYELASMLTDRPLSVPKHRMLIDQSDAAWADAVVEKSNNLGLLDILREALRKEAGPAFGLIDQLLKFSRFIIDELNAGRRLTNPTSLFGVEKIEPHPKAYAKPVIVLINELDFSAGDFLPAILQDNKRATLFGIRTAGAGGAVKSVEFPNQFGIEALAYTWTIAVRDSGKPIENLGVAPDVRYEITAEDIKNGFAGYAKALNGLVDSLIPGAPGGAAASGPSEPK